MRSDEFLAHLGGAAQGPRDPDLFHRSLAKWNRRRLAVGAPSPHWAEDVEADCRMLLLEGAFIEAFRAYVAPMVAAAPRDAPGFVAWFEGLKDSGPG